MKEIIDEIIENISLVEVVGEYVLLKKRGKNYLGLCPFHTEKTPSFNVNPENNLYYCFGCGAGGNVFNFLMAIENISFQEAINILAAKANIVLPQKTTHNYGQLMGKKEKLFNAYQLAAKFYQYILFDTKYGEPGREYLKQRGYPINFSKVMGLGMAPPGWNHLFTFLTKKTFSPELLAEGGLVVPRNNNKGYYDRFRSRIMFPIFNNKNQPIAFGGRLIGASQDQPKYLNSPETILFNKSKNLYGLNWASKPIQDSGRSVFVEGYTDVLTAHLYGINNCVASLGTALSQDQARILKRLSDNVYIGYDSDEAGQNATNRSLEIFLRENLKVFIIHLEKGHDPDSFIRKYGGDAFQARINNSKIHIMDSIEEILKNNDIHTSLGRIQAIKECVEVLKDINDEIEKEIYLQHVVNQLEVPYNTLKTAVEKKLLEKSKNKDNNSSQRHTNNKQPQNSLRFGLEERILAGLFNMKNSHYLSLLKPKDFKNPIYSEIISELIQGKTIDDILLNGNNEFNFIISYIRSKDLSDSLDNLISKLKLRQNIENKKNILKQLKANNLIDLNTLNYNLLLYREALELDRGLEKEG